MSQYLSRRLGLDSVTFGYLQTAFGALQLLGGPMFGRYRPPTRSHGLPCQVPDLTLGPPGGRQLPFHRGAH